MLNHVLLGNNQKKLTIFLHGMMGNLRNLKPLANSPDIKEKTDALLIDLPNHGSSPHISQCTVPEMARSVHNLLSNLNMHSKYEKSNIYSFKSKNTFFAL